jgi:spermidine/putrescine transport system ATP-binding protein
MSESPALELVKITKRFGDVVAVDSITLRIERGEFFSLLGPSGCGKSTTLRMIAGFEEPSSGELFLNGHEGSQLPPFKRSTNLVFQSYALFPHMTVRENVAYGPKRARKSRAEVAANVEEALRTVKMWEYADRLPKALSGGQRQRVALARGIVNRPAVLLLDEPLGALDLKLRREMQIELKQIQREVGICFVYVTHDQEEALTLSDRIAVMNGGRIEQLGTPEEIYRRPASRFCADFIGEANLIDAVIDEVERGEPRQVVLPDGQIIAIASCSTERVFARGDEATLVLRPQHISLHETRPQGEGLVCIRVDVTAAIFQGSLLRYELTGPAGLSLTSISVDANKDNVSVGSDRWACWSLSDCHVVENN